MKLLKSRGAKIALALTAVSLLLAGCHYHRPYYGGAYYGYHGCKSYHYKRQHHHYHHGYRGHD